MLYQMMYDKRVGRTRYSVRRLVSSVEWVVEVIIYTIKMGSCKENTSVIK